MKIGDMGKGESSFIRSFSVWNPLSNFISWAFKNKSIYEAPAVKVGLYMSLTGSLCSLIESVCEYILVKNLNTNIELSEQENLLTLLKDVKEARWNDYDSIYKKVFDNNLSFYVKNHKVSVDYLFKLRNSIIHGNRLQLKTTINQDSLRSEIIGGKYREVYNFLIQKHVIAGAKIDFMSDPSILFSDDVMEYFKKEVLVFIKLLYKSDLFDEYDRNLIDTNLLHIIEN